MTTQCPPHDASVDMLLVAATNDGAARARLFSRLQPEVARYRETRIGGATTPDAHDDVVRVISGAVTAAQRGDHVERKDLHRVLAAITGTVRDIFDHLPGDQRSVLRLRVERELTISGTARVLGLSPATVRVAEHRAITTILRALRESPPPA